MLIIIVVVVAVVFGCGIFSALGIYGFRRYLARARAARSTYPPVGAPGAGGSGATGPALVSGGHVLASTDGHSQLTLPRSWRSMPELGGEGVVRAGDATTDQYVLVITEDKKDFAAQVDLAKYGEVVLRGMKRKLTNPVAGAPVALTIGGRPALQYEVQGALELFKIGYLVTVIDGAGHYHQVLAWTAKSKFNGARTSLRRLVGSFRER